MSWKKWRHRCILTEMPDITSKGYRALPKMPEIPIGPFTTTLKPCCPSSKYSSKTFSTKTKWLPSRRVLSHNLPMPSSWVCFIRRTAKMFGGEPTHSLYSIRNCRIVYLVDSVIHPGLTPQKHSALISSDSEYFQVCFCTVHYLKISEQRWFSSEQRWQRKFSELKISAVSAMISSATALSRAVFWRIQNDNVFVTFFIFSKFFEVPQFWGSYFRFSTSQGGAQR